MNATQLALAMLWAGVGIVAGFTLYSYLSPRIQKQAMPKKS
jgi:predicted MFS family arabinose efflux permease